MGSTKESGSNQESGDGTPQRLGCVQICSLGLHQQDITHSQRPRGVRLRVLLIACYRSMSCAIWSMSRDHTVMNCTGLPHIHWQAGYSLSPPPPPFAFPPRPYCCLWPARPASPPP